MRANGRVCQTSDCPISNEPKTTQKLCLWPLAHARDPERLENQKDRFLDVGMCIWRVMVSLATTRSTS